MVGYVKDGLLKCFMINKFWATYTVLLALKLVYSLYLIEATNIVQERVIMVQVPVLKIWNLKLFWCHHSVFITLSTIGLCVVVAIVAFFGMVIYYRGIDKKNYKKIGNFIIQFINKVYFSFQKQLIYAFNIAKSF